MSDYRPLLSVVIPTRERSETLVHTLHSALKQDSASYEVLVSDNASQDRTPDVVAAVRDARVRYVRTERRLSMCDNWEFALSHARGRYVIYIGDDDAILPNGVDRLIGMMKTHPSRAYAWTPPLYTWPIDGHSAQATYIPRASPVRELDLVAMARFVIRYGGWRYYLLPGVYHAALEREVLEAIGRETGRVFRSTQPDLITSMSVPAIVRKAVHTGYPITLSGISARSNAASSSARDGQLVLQRYIQEFGDYRVHPSLCPVLPLYANLVMDSILLARDAFPRLYGDTTFNYDAMLAFLCRWRLISPSFVLSHREDLRRHHPFNPLRFAAYTAFFEGATLRRRSLNWFARHAPVAKAVPSDVCEFAHQYDRWTRAGAPFLSSMRSVQNSAEQN